MATDPPTGFVLEMLGIHKAFPGVVALEAVDLRLRPGTVHALVGENGAGKSTLMNCLFGIVAPDAGTIVLDGAEVAFPSPRAALDAGISMIQQELHPIPDRSVMENIWLGRFPTRRIAGLLGIDTVWLEAECSRYEFFSDVVKQTQPDIALVSLDADSTRGLALVASLSADLPGCSVLVISSSQEGSLILQAMRNGAKEFLNFPLRLEDFLAALDRIRQAFERDPNLPNLLLDKDFAKAIKTRAESWRKTVHLGVKLGVALPAMSASLAYFDGFRRARTPANLIQGQRDFFGAHTYERLDREGIFHTEWSGGEDEQLARR